MIIYDYNNLAVDEGWEKASTNTGRQSAHIWMPCKLVDTISDDSYGKFPKSMIEDMVVMEWQYWLRYFSKYLVNRFTDNRDFMNYLQTEGMQN